MPSVVIIHAADDALPARALGEKLRQANLTPVIEKAPGEDRQGAIKNAAVCIALWSPRSIADAGVSGDVAFARGKGKLVHACMQSVQPPGDFRSEQWVDLTGWRGEDDFAGWRQLAASVTEKAGVAPLAPAAPRPPSGFFQPGRNEATQPAPQTAPAPQPAPAPRAAQPQRAAPLPPPLPPLTPPPPRMAPIEPDEKRGGPNIAVIGIVTFLVVALAGGGGYYFWSQSQGGGAFAAAWEELDRTDPAALRAFLAGEPGSLRGEAQATLGALEQARYDAARSGDTIEALEAFAADFPGSSHNLVVRGRIAELRAQPTAPEEVELPAEIIAPAEPLDPDLVPPGTTATPPISGGPVQLQPELDAEPEPDEPPAPAEPGATPG